MRVGTAGGEVTVDGQVVGSVTELRIGRKSSVFFNAVGIAPNGEPIGRKLYARLMTSPYLLMQGIDERSFVVLDEFEGGLVDSGFRIELERDGKYHLSHADDKAVSDAVFRLGAFDSELGAVEAFTVWRTQPPPS